MSHLMATPLPAAFAGPELVRSHGCALPALIPSLAQLIGFLSAILCFHTAGDTAADGEQNLASRACETGSGLGKDAAVLRQLMVAYSG